MKTFDVIIVGGGPAGSTCAFQLTRYGKKVLILDRHQFPRLKLCAGWITPRVLHMLRFHPDDYPHGILEFKRLYFNIKGKKFALPTRQYSIRRYEFDNWLIQRSGATVIQHTVRHIIKDNGYFIIDDQFNAPIIVGAGGTNCPVYHQLFEPQAPRNPQDRIATFEEEFPYEYTDNRCYLWFFENDLPGYSWYVPKGNGYVNVGIGAKIQTLKQRGENLREHWLNLIERIEAQGLVRNHKFQNKGYQYFLRQPIAEPQIGNAYIIGDAAGLATVDMGEGIAPAIHSGLLAAQAILTGKPLRFNRIARYSFWDLLFWWRWRKG